MESLAGRQFGLIATDHAPHTFAEKMNLYKSACRFAIGAAFRFINASLCKREKNFYRKMVEKMSHAVATCFQIAERGFIREGYFADCVMVDLNEKQPLINKYFIQMWLEPLENSRFRQL